MKILWGSKDGGPESNVRMWGFESKRWGSILLLCFAAGSREAFHTHAFKAISWLLSGALIEEVRLRRATEWNVRTLVPDYMYQPSFKPIRTPRNRMHKVHGFAERSWVISFRGPWKATWLDWPDNRATPQRLSWGRKEVV